jgi:hypothetical protein
VQKVRTASSAGTSERQRATKGNFLTGACPWAAAVPLLHALDFRASDVVRESGDQVRLADSSGNR